MPKPEEESTSASPKEGFGRQRGLLLVGLCLFVVLFHFFSTNTILQTYQIIAPMGESAVGFAMNREEITESLNELDMTQDEQVQDSSPSVFAFMTEPRCLAAVPFVLENALEKLPTSFPVVFFHSHHNAHCVKRWLNETPALLEANQAGRLILEHEPHMDPDSKLIYVPTNWNNVLYQNITFWESLRQYGKTALTLQADTMICDGVGDSNQYNYTPPWHVNFLGGISWVNNAAVSNATNTYHLNGGLSIRNVDWVISCLSGRDNFTTIEDDLFCNCTGGVDNVTVVDAMSFASDNGHTNCFTWQGRRQCPWAVHKPWAQRQRGYPELLNYCPGFQKLQKLLRTPGRRKRFR